MKILITTEQFPPIVSGISSVVFGLSKALVKRGHEVTVVTKKEFSRNLQDYPEITIKEFNIQGGFGNIYRGECQSYIDFVINFQCDVMINECVQTWNSDLLFPYLSKIRAIKILHSHGFSLLNTKTLNLWAYIKSKYYYHRLTTHLNQYHKILILSKISKEKVFFDEKKFKNYAVFPNGIMSELYAQEEKIVAEKPMLLSISNFFPLKNQAMILEAFYQIQYEAEMIFIGTSQLHGYLNYLQELKKTFDQRYGFKKVLFYQNLSRKETLDLLKQATLFLHGSKLEAFPVVILEAMATKTPWICTNVGNVEELEGGIIVKNSIDMAHAVNLLLKDMVFYRQLSQRGFMCAKELYHWDALVQKLEIFFIQCIEKKR